MNFGFWAKLNRPFSVSAPLAGVSDFAFREILAVTGKPDVIFNEMVTTEGLSAKGEEEFALQMSYTEAERPIVAQIFGSRPDRIEAAAEIIARRGFDGVDINMGCPQDVITNQGAGAALIKTPDLAVRIIEAARRGAGDLPVSVKTRTGWKDHSEGIDWVRRVAEAGPALMTVHGRTREMKGRGTASWDVIGRMVEAIKEVNPEIIIVGNGDVADMADGKEKAKKYNLDGFMIGRAAIGNPWIFSGKIPTLEERISVLLRHTDLFIGHFGEPPFDRLKTHYSEYISGFAGAKELRDQLMTAKNSDEARMMAEGFLKTRPGN